MSVRVGHIFRHEDVHGVSGTGRVADVFEASNGKAIVVWTSSNPSVVVYDNVKALENTHGHGGKTDVVWVFEEEREPDPMEKIFEKKIIEAGGTPAKSGTDSPQVFDRTVPHQKAPSKGEADAISEEILTDTVVKVAKAVVKQLKEKENGTENASE